MYYIVTNSDSTAFVKYKGPNIVVTYDINDAHRFNMKTARRVKSNPTKLMRQFGEWKIVQDNKGLLGKEMIVDNIDLSQIQCLEDKAEEIVDFVKSAKEIKALYKSLCEDESEIDRKLCDKYHDIENGKYSASQGYKELMELQRILIERRKIKNTVKMAQYVTKVSFQKIADGSLVSAINGLGNEKYKRRIED